MAISCTNRGTAASNASSSTTYAFSPASNFASGSLAVICVSADNSSTGGATNNVSSVTDSIGNTWKLVQRPIFDNGAASAGIQGAIAYTDMSAGTITTGTTITVTFGAATTAKSYTLHEVVPTAGKVIGYVQGGVATGKSGTTAPTMTTGTITNGNLLIATFAMESGTTQTFTDDADTTNGTWSASQYSEVGSTTSGNCIGTQYKIQTTTNSTQTYNPTLGATADTVGAWAEFTEGDPQLLKSKDFQLPVIKPKARVPDYFPNLLLSTFTQAAASTDVIRQPLITPIFRRKLAQDTNLPNLLLTTLAGSGPVSVGLTGSQVTSSAGTLSASIAEALSGAQASASAGTLTANIAEALAGSQASTSAGTLAPTASVPLSGSQVSATAGTLGVVGVNAPFLPDNLFNPSGRTRPQPTHSLNLLTTTLTQSVSVGLSGSQVTVSAGSLGVSDTLGLTGEQVTASTGTLSGQVDTGTVLRVPLVLTRAVAKRSLQPEYVPNLLVSTLASSDVNVTLTGSVVTTYAGTLTPVSSNAPFRQNEWTNPKVRTQIRRVLETPNLLLTTLRTTLVAFNDSGNPERRRTRAQPTEVRNLLLTTLQASSTTVALTGSQVTSSAGTLAPSSSKVLTGSQVAVSAGTLATTNSLTVSSTLSLTFGLSSVKTRGIARSSVQAITFGLSGSMSSGQAQGVTYNVTQSILFGLSSNSSFYKQYGSGSNKMIRRGRRITEKVRNFSRG